MNNFSPALPGAALALLALCCAGWVAHVGMPAAAVERAMLPVALPLHTLLHYPASWVWPLTRLACLLFAGVCYLAMRRGALDLRQLGAAALSYAALLAAFGLCALLWQSLAVLAGHEQQPHARSIAGNRYIALLLVIPGIVLFAARQRTVQHTHGPAAAAMGTLLVMLVLLLGASYHAPGASHLFAWPLIAALCGVGLQHVSGLTATQRALRQAATIAAALAALLLWLPVLVHQVMLFSPARIALLLLALFLALGFASALCTQVPRRVLVPVLVAFFTTVILASPVPPAVDTRLLCGFTPT